MGRKKTPGTRSPSGRKKKASTVALRAKHDYGNDRVQARVDLFRVFRGDGAIGHEMTCAGRLMLVGAFDGLDYAPEVILSAMLEYEQAYWGNYQGGARVSDYQQEVRHFGSISGEMIERDWHGNRFKALDDILRSCGAQTRQAVIEATVDTHWFPERDASWAERIINQRILEKRLSYVKAGKPIPEALVVNGQPRACDSDWAMLQLLRDGAVALVRGGMPEVRRAA